MSEAASTNSKSRLLLVGLVLAVCAVGIAAVLVFSGHNQKPVDTSMGLGPCALRQADQKLLTLCISKATTRLLAENPRPDSVIPKLDAQITRRGPDWAGPCHNAMHLTGSKFAKANNVSLINLQQYLPLSNSNNCSAGFAHGMISVLGLNTQKARAMMEQVCAKASSRSVEFACIHGIGHGLRRYLGSPSIALKGCAALRGYAISDCAQGIYHDYFMAALSSPDASNNPLGTKAVDIKDLGGRNKIRTESSKLDQFCLNQPKRFLRECWYRLIAGPGIPVPVGSAQDIEFACGGLSEPQHGACITGLTTARFPPEEIAKVCRDLQTTSIKDSVSCISGVDLLSVGWSAPVKGPARYHDEDMPGIIAQCLIMKEGKPQSACIKTMSLFSLRTIPDQATQAKALSVCRKLKGKPLGQCKSTLLEALAVTQEA